MNYGGMAVQPMLRPCGHPARPTLTFASKAVQCHLAVSAEFPRLSPPDFLGLDPPDFLRMDPADFLGLGPPAPSRRENEAALYRRAQTRTGGAHGAEDFDGGSLCRDQAAAAEGRGVREIARALGCSRRSEIAALVSNISVRCSLDQRDREARAQPSCCGQKAVGSMSCDATVFSAGHPRKRESDL